MPRVFISYRRDDSAGYSLALYNVLTERLGADSVFMDVDNIPPGADYRHIIDDAVGSCDAFIALIGPNWLGAADDADNRRLESAGDFVRLEIESALRRQNVLVIPVLVQGATMPAAADLPLSLQDLTWRNAVELSNTRFNYDANRLIDGINSTLNRSAGTGTVSRQLQAADGSGIGDAIARDSSRAADQGADVGGAGAGTKEPEGRQASLDEEAGKTQGTAPVLVEEETSGPTIAARSWVPFPTGIVKLLDRYGLSPGQAASLAAAAALFFGSFVPVFTYPDGSGTSNLWQVEIHASDLIDPWNLLPGTAYFICTLGVIVAGASVLARSSRSRWLEAVSSLAGGVALVLLAVDLVRFLTQSSNGIGGTAPQLDGGWLLLLLGAALALLAPTLDHWPATRRALRRVGIGSG